MFMGSSNEFGSSSYGSARKRPHRHSDQQTQKLEAYFKINQHPNERERCQLGREVGLTPTQIKFWFQNKRTLTKAQSGRLEGSALRQENERMKCENLAMLEALKDGSCIICKGLSPNKEEKLRICSQLKAENEQLKAEYARLTNILAQSGYPMPEKIPQQDSCDGVPQIPIFSTGSHYPEIIHEPTWEQKKKLNQDLNTARIVQIATTAFEELTALVTVESLWMKDPNDGRFVIHRNNYEKAFMKNTHLSTSNTRVESSKEDGIVRMRGPQLVAMLQNSIQENMFQDNYSMILINAIFFKKSRRLDLFPTIITKSITLHQLQAGNSASNGALQLVNEQVHILSPLVAPRDFDLIRYSEQVDSSAWIIVDVSHSLPNDDKLQKSPFCAWKFPSGCLIRDLANGFSKILWVEHIEVDDKALIHPLYRDTILGSLGYGAQRWISTLQTMCERFSLEMGESSISKEVESISNPQGRKGIMNLTERMMKNLFANLSMKSNMDIPQSFPQDDTETRLSVYKSIGPGIPSGMIINATTSLRIPFSYQALFSFFTNARKRHQWDAFWSGIQVEEIASVTYGHDLRNRVSLIQPLIPGNSESLLVQESCVDFHGGVIVYAPLHKNFADMILNGEDSSTIPVLASGFIISRDVKTITAAKDGVSSSTTSQNGSVLTVALQILPSESSTSDQISALISSTIQKIKLSLNDSNFE